MMPMGIFALRHDLLQGVLLKFPMWIILRLFLLHSNSSLSVLFFAITAYLNLELHHVDIETAFFHGDLKEEMYMEQPQLLKDELHPNYVYKLHKPVYGLKPSPRQW